MSWKTFHSRGETLRVVMDTTNDRRDGVLPMDLAGVAENFTDELDLIGALLLKWHARLSGNIERAMLREPLDLESAVAAAWHATAEEMPGVRLVVDRCAESPAGPEMERAMARAREKEWARLAIAAGLANTPDDAASAVGRRVEERARRGLAHSAAQSAAQSAGRSATEPAAPARTVTHTVPGAHRATGSFADRIKAVLAA
jgi:hypothetical protein